MSGNPQELGSERFTRVANAAWPFCVGVFGMVLIVCDALIWPPPDNLTMTAGTTCIVVFGGAKLIRFDRGPHGD